MRIFLLVLALLSFPALGGEVVFKCLGPSGSHTYQDFPCPGAQEVIKVEHRSLGESLAEATIRDYRNSAPRQAAARNVTPTPPATSPQPSFECRAADGSVFYRHDGCPSFIPGTRRVYFSRGTELDYYNEVLFVPVDSRPVTRRSACSTIYGSSSSSRTGSNLDQRYSTYERNLGRDPCR